MRNLHLLLLIICLSICSCYELNAQSKFGNATMEELEMTSYPQDSTASAVFLLKKGNVRFVWSDLYGFQFEYTYQAKIKILKKEGLDWCNHEIGYYQLNTNNKEQINGLNGTTYNLEDGKIVKTKLSKEFIFEEDSDKKLKIKKITMPGAKVGSVIEYKYTIVSDFYYDLRDFDFQSGIPVMYSLFEAKLPEYFKYNLNIQGYVRLNTKKEPENESFFIRYRAANGQQVNESVRCAAEGIKIEGKDIPAMKNEKYLWTTNDYISKISFELMSVQFPFAMTKNYTTTWANIDKEILDSGSFGGNLKKEDLFKNEIAPSDNTIDKAREIQNLVKGKVKWNDRNSMWPDNLKEALKTGLGNNADINFLLVNALKAGGFDAFPVILSTRNNGRIPVTHPSASAFNYVITGLKIDTTFYFTDASAKYGDWNILPEKCMVTQGRIMKQNNCDWIDLSTISTGSVLKAGRTQFVDSKLQAQVQETRRGNAAYNFRSKYFSFKDENEFIESLAKNLNCEISDFKVENLQQTNETIKASYTQSSDAALGDEFIYINPLLEKLFDENPFKEENRIYPINFNHLLNYMQMIDVIIPEGYDVEELPKSERIVLNNGDLNFTYRIAKSENVIKIQYQLQIKKLLFVQTEYQEIRDFFSKLILKNSEQIVLKKIN